MAPQVRLTILIVLLMLAPSSYAENSYAPSIEWLTCEADIVVLGKIKQATPAKGADGYIYEDTVVQVEQTLKGSVLNNEVHFAAPQITGPSASDLLSSAAEVLVFLRKVQDDPPYLRGKYVPLGASPGSAIFDLSKPLTRVYSKSMEIVESRERATALVLEWSRSTIKQGVRAEVPLGSPVFSRLYGGSAVYLTVPADETVRAKFIELARSKDTGDQLHAVEELWKFPDSEIRALLWELLDDAAEGQSFSSNDGLSAIVFPVRKAAAESLRQMGEFVPEEVTLRREPTAEEQQKYRTDTWRNSFEGALPKGWKVNSVTTGETRVIEGRPMTILVVHCSNGDESLRFTLTPKEWPVAELPRGPYLGMQKDTWGGRYFHLEVEAPATLKDRVVSYFELTR